jgi:hypothetical protein
MQAVINIGSIYRVIGRLHDHSRGYVKLYLFGSLLYTSELHACKKTGAARPTRDAPSERTRYTGMQAHGMQRHSSRETVLGSFFVISCNLKI